MIRPLLAVSFAFLLYSRSDAQTTIYKGAEQAKATGNAGGRRSEEAAARRSVAFKAADIKGTYTCISGGVPQLQGDGIVSKAAVDAAAATAKAYGSALKYQFRGDGTFADLTWGDKYAADPKYNGTYKLEGRQLHLYSAGTLFYTFNLARNEEGKIVFIQVHEAADRYKAQFCQLAQ